MEAALPLILLLIPIVILMLLSVAAQKYKNEIKLTDLGLCPPHKWRYDEIKDAEGKVLRTRMVCDRCGPLRPLDAPEKMDY